ncbi:MAG: hypothetical protein QF570_06155 [Myxococcota bacterium]|jgi:hypothetical protein|nr:hypothetical protein [Myxococcota bacterium]
MTRDHEKKVDCRPTKNNRADEQHKRATEQVNMYAELETDESPVGSA